jgi:hypothetical protein
MTLYSRFIARDINELKDIVHSGIEVILISKGIFAYVYDETITADEVIGGIYVKVKSNVMPGGWLLKASFPQVIIIYVSETGNDTNDGLAPDRPIYSTAGLINSLNLTYDSETGYYDASNIIVNLKGTTSDAPTSSLNPSFWVSNFRVFHNIKFYKVIANNVRFVFKQINIGINDFDNGEDFEGQIYSFNGIELNNCAIQVCDSSGNIFWSGRDVYFCECPFSYVNRFKTAFVVVNGDFKLKMNEELRLRTEHRQTWYIFNPLVEMKNWGDVIIDVKSVIGTYSGGGIVKGNVNKVKIDYSSGSGGAFSSRTHPERDNIVINEGYIQDDNNPLSLPELTNLDRRFKMLYLVPPSNDKTLRSLFLGNPELPTGGLDVKFIGSNYASLGRTLINASKLVIDNGDYGGNTKRLYYVLLTGEGTSLLDYFYRLDTRYIKNLDRRTLIRVYLRGSSAWIQHYFCESILQTPILTLNPLQTECIITAETGDVLNIYLVGEITQQFSEDYTDVAYIDLGTNYSAIEEIDIACITPCGNTSDYDEYLLEFSPDGSTWTSFGVDTSIWPRNDLTTDTTRTFKSYNAYYLRLENSNFAFYLQRYMRLRRVNTVGTPTRNFTNDITVIKRAYAYAPSSIIYYRKKVMGLGSPGKVHYFTNVSSSTQRIRVEYKFV